MEFFNIFFRGIPSDYVFKLFSLLHFAILLLGLMGIFWIKKLHDNKRESKKIINILVVGLIMQQTILYIWYMSSGYFTLKESLPFYNCRIASIAIGLGYVFKKDKLLALGVNWGLMGAPIALLIPTLDPFGYDHYTFYSFFIGHLFLLWASFYMSYVDEREFGQLTIKSLLEFTTLYHILIGMFNWKIASNYCYLREAPLFTDMFNKLNKAFYMLGVIVVFNLVLYMTNKVIDGLENKEKRERLALLM